MESLRENERRERERVQALSHPVLLSHPQKGHTEPRETTGSNSPL